MNSINHVFIFCWLNITTCLSLFSVWTINKVTSESISLQNLNIDSSICSCASQITCTFFLVKSNNCFWQTRKWYYFALVGTKRFLLRGIHLHTCNEWQKYLHKKKDLHKKKKKSLCKSLHLLPIVAMWSRPLRSASNVNICWHSFPFPAAADCQEELPNSKCDIWCSRARFGFHSSSPTSPSWGRSLK